MTQQEMDCMYKEHLPLLQRIVRTFAASANIPYELYDELFSQARLFFVIACVTHNPERTKLPTWIHRQVKGRLKTSFRDECENWKRVNHPDDIRDRRLHKANDMLADLKLFELMDGLTEGAKELIILARSGELDFDEILRGRKRKVHAERVYASLRSLGWPRGKINRAYKGLQELL